MFDVVAPILSLNGDRAATLIANLENAYKAVRSAMTALRETAPNGRNFPGYNLMPQAVRQHQERMSALKGVLDSLGAEANAIQVQQEKS